MPSATELVSAANDGDEHAWNALTEQYTGLLWAIARAHRLSAADAGDVVQTTWLRLVENLGRLNDAERVGAWLATTARRECLRVLRRGNRLVVTDEDLEVTVAEASPAASPEAQVVISERDRLLYDAVNNLPDRCRILVRILMTDPPPNYEDVSVALDMPIGSIGPTRARCLQRLRRSLDAAGVDR